MDYLILKETYDELLERLDMYFDEKLQDDKRVRDNLESYKQDLLQEHAFEIWSSYGNYADYDPKKFIWMKAKDVWIDFIRKIGRDKKRRSAHQLDQLTNKADEAAFLDKFQKQDTISLIETMISPMDMELLHLRADGYTYREIQAILRYPSSDAAKTKFNRIKNVIRQRFGRR